MFMGAYFPYPDRKSYGDPHLGKVLDDENQLRKCLGKIKRGERVATLANLYLSHTLRDLFFKNHLYLYIQKTPMDEARFFCKTGIDPSDSLVVRKVDAYVGK